MNWTQPKYQCPLCQKKWHTRQQVIDCMELDKKESQAKDKRLKPVINLFNTDAK
jgi:hypothetical protein